MFVCIPILGWAYCWLCPHYLSISGGHMVLATIPLGRSNKSPISSCNIIHWTPSNPTETCPPWTSNWLTAGDHPFLKVQCKSPVHGMGMLAHPTYKSLRVKFFRFPAIRVKSSLFRFKSFLFRFQVFPPFQTLSLLFQSGSARTPRISVYRVKREIWTGVASSMYIYLFIYIYIHTNIYICIYIYIWCHTNHSSWATSRGSRHFPGIGTIIAGPRNLAPSEVDR